MSKQREKGKISLIERIGNRIPDPVYIFIILYTVVFVITGIAGGYEFYAPGKDGQTVPYVIKNMFSPENVRWALDGALLDNWLSYGGGILGTMLIVMFGIGLADESGLLSCLITKANKKVSTRFLPYVLVFLGILSNIATDAGYIVLIPLAGLLYLGAGENPLIGMAAAFAGVSAGFSANIFPSTIVDVTIGNSAKSFAEEQGIPFISFLGKEIHPALMNYFFMLTSAFLLVIAGGFVTSTVTKRKLSGKGFEKAALINQKAEFTEQERKREKRALIKTGIALLTACIFILVLATTVLSPYTDTNGKKVTPLLDNVVLFITFLFAVSGISFGLFSGKFKKSKDVIGALSKQVGSMGYVIVLTFFCYNFLALLNYTNIGTYITFAGAEFLKNIGVSHSPVLLIIAFIMVTGFINLFVGGMTSKWMLLGPVFIPMLYRANSFLTPDIVAAAYRIADSSTNVITPLMTYAGVVLSYMRKHDKDFGAGNLISLMFPYSLAFIVSWTLLLFIFLFFKIPLGI